MKERAHLIRVEHDRTITKEADRRFLFEFQRGILLSLKADGLLDETQYRYAEDRLRCQMRNDGRNQNNA